MNDESSSTGESPEKLYRLMHSNVEAADAIEQIVNAAERELRIFDASPRTLQERGFGSPSRIGTLHALLQASRGHRLRIVLHDVRAIENTLPRLVDLLTRFSGQILVHRTIGRATEASDPMIIADDRHYWRKLHVAQPRSVLTLHGAGDTQPFIERFEQIWEQSELALSGSTLGL